MILAFFLVCSYFFPGWLSISVRFFLMKRNTCTPSSFMFSALFLSVWTRQLRLHFEGFKQYLLLPKASIQGVRFWWLSITNFPSNFPILKSLMKPEAWSCQLSGDSVLSVCVLVPNTLYCWVFSVYKCSQAGKLLCEHYLSPNYSPHLVLPTTTMHTSSFIK